MNFEDKLLQIIKYERRTFYITICFMIILIPFIVWFFGVEKNINFYFSILAILLVYLVLGVIAYKKLKIIIKLKWSLKNYVENAHEVQAFLKNRRASLKSLQGELNLYHLYDEALILLSEILIKKYA